MTSKECITRAEICLGRAIDTEHHRPEYRQADAQTAQAYIALAEWKKRDEAEAKERFDRDYDLNMQFGGNPPR
jgi:hypothetical protein